MSSLAFSASWGGAVVFAAKKEPALVLQRLAAFPKLAGVTAASRLEVRPTPEMVSCGIREIDELAGGLPRGCLSEICGPASSGRTSVLLSALAAATRRQEVCALVDTTDALDSVSAAAAGVELERLLWIRCGRGADLGPQTSDLRPQTSKSDARRLTPNVRGPQSAVRIEQALRVTDLLLQSGGFGLAYACGSRPGRRQSRRSAPHRPALATFGRQAAPRSRLRPGWQAAWQRHSRPPDRRDGAGRERLAAAGGAGCRESRSPAAWRGPDAARVR